MQKKESRRLNKQRMTSAIEELVDQYISEQRNNTFNYRQVSHAIGVTTMPQQKAVAMRLAELAFDGKLFETSPGKYRRAVHDTETVGVFVRRNNGKNSVVIDDGDMIAVDEDATRHALNGDKVRVRIQTGSRDAEPVAEVTDILERAEQVFVGTLQVEANFGYLLNESKTLDTDIFIPKAKLNGGEDGDKAVVKITEWPRDMKNPRGEVVDVLGRKGENNAEIHAILAEFGLPYHYPEAVENAASKIGAGITPMVIKERTDMRDVVTFTIDPKDAKDFDDALSMRRLGNGRIEVGVHIADVTHYVRPDTIIDKEAQKRATSVYLVDRVVPMLPEHLCNGICSLRPDEEKLAFSCIFEMDEDGKVYGSKICRTVIKSNRRFTYEEAQEVIESGHGDYAEEMLTLDRIAKSLRKQRFENGSMEFDRPEVKFEIAQDGHPTDVYFKVSKDANKLVEELMLIANRTVAEFVGRATGKKSAKAFVYRIHDQPDPGKLSDLARLAHTFGYDLKTTGSPKDINKSINKMLAEIKGRAEENLLSVLAVRSMAKAVYSTHNIGHYGLGFDYYTHFTSPRRRYPDMLVHRLLARYLAGGRSVGVDKLEDQCKHCSDMEQTAAQAERSSIKYKQVEYMADRLGDEYMGVVSGVTEWGLYVELDENLCEGLVPMRDLTDDFYEFDERNFCLVGRKTNVRYRLGDKVRIKVARADLEKRQLDFALVTDCGPDLKLKKSKKRQ
ncbi:MAG: ribonuclease R [Muribaculaceae bacterium]|nr:ribonuclease R [Muribaculaceae bacterium]